jgi:hypothetical protein
MSEPLQAGDYTFSSSEPESYITDLFAGVFCTEVWIIFDLPNV